MTKTLQMSLLPLWINSQPKLTNDSQFQESICEEYICYESTYKSSNISEVDKYFMNGH